MLKKLQKNITLKVFQEFFWLISFIKQINKMVLNIKKKNLNTMKEDIKLIRTMTNDKDYGTMVDRSSKDIH